MNKVIKFITNAINKISTLVENHYKIVFAIILLIAIILNAYRLGEVPKGINCDEAGMGYDAYCIANYGVDRYLTKSPIYFTNFGDGQNALYTYLASCVIKFIGFTNLSIRIPALILSIIEVIIAYFLVKDFKGKKMGLLFMLIVTISPWHIMKSRWGLESYLLSPMLLFSMYALLKASTADKKRYAKFFLAGLLFGMTLYTYAVSYFIVPIFLSLTGIYLLRKKKINIREILIFAIPLIILAIPLIVMLMVQKGWIQPIESFITIQKLPTYRENEINITKILDNLKTIRYTFLVDSLSFNSIEKFGNFYYFAIPIMIIGFFISIYKSVSNRKSTKIDLDAIMLFMFVANFIWGILIETNTNRLNGILISATYFILIALQEIYKFRKEIFGITGIAYLISFIMFVTTYFTKFANTDNWLFDNNFIDLVKYLDKYEGKEIYFNTKTHEPWIYELYAEKENPYEVYDTYKYNKFNRVYEYGRYHNNNQITEYNDNSIYVFDNKEKAEELVEKGYKEDTNNQYYILYK